eukprot:CAMPEP_0195508378 /NCGR_PEP_ID=MMETSP0794_2-20130614/1593_1 /TAXON_ID=515487 /ORGANISM="Stephanopyxis turris, Strain CCMP 815" /LENGTH=450 /DNA_ID=CAMNT_0040635321 /DNA_START=145 /DNA_END=1497 /DNA_ORIENTATION=-
MYVSSVAFLVLGLLTGDVFGSEIPKLALGKQKGRQLKSAKADKMDKVSKKGKSSKSPSFSSAVFTMTNAPTGNGIIMFTRDEETGILTLAPASPFDTGGVGGDAALDPNTNDPLASQGPLIVSGSCLLAANAGSNTVSTFQILSDRIELVSIVGSGGEIPVSIASNGSGLVYVLNAGLAGSISGFNLDQETCAMSSIDDSTVSLKLTPLADEMVPDTPFFVSSPVQIEFTPSGAQLIVVIKGIRGNPFVGGTINRYAVDGESGLVSNPNVHEIGADALIPFGFDFDGAGNLLLVDVFGTGPFGDLEASESTLISFDVESTNTTRGARVGLGTNIGCWVQYNSVDGCVFTANTGPNSISSVQVQNGNLTLIESVAANVIAPLEPRFSPDGRFMYTFSSGVAGEVTNGQPSIYVHDTTSSGRTCGLTEIQIISDGIPNTDTTVFGATGLAVF